MDIETNTLWETRFGQGPFPQQVVNRLDPGRVETV